MNSTKMILRHSLSHWLTVKMACSYTRLYKFYFSATLHYGGYLLVSVFAATYLPSWNIDFLIIWEVVYIKLVPITKYAKKRRPFTFLLIIALEREFLHGNKAMLTCVFYLVGLVSCFSDPVPINLSLFILITVHIYLSTNLIIYLSVYHIF